MILGPLSGLCLYFSFFFPTHATCLNHHRNFELIILRIFSKGTIFMITEFSFAFVRIYFFFSSWVSSS